MTNKRLQQFRDAVYQNLQKRPDAIMDLIDALTVAGHVASPVALSEEGFFRRKFSMIYDALQHAVIDFDGLWDTLLTFQPDDSECIAGLEVYGLDTTPNERPEAETLPERCSLKSQKDEPVRYGHKYSWLVRLAQWGTSWVAPQDLVRVDPELSDNQVGSQQVEGLAQLNSQPKVVVADSLYGNHVFLGVFQRLKNTFSLVRMRGTNVLYEKPPAKLPGKRGAPCKHGLRFKLSCPPRPAERDETFPFGLQMVRVRAWQDLHLKKLPALVVMVLKVEFLKPDGQPRYKQPMWLLWTGPPHLALADLVKMYLWRFAIEHLFRFLKQNLGLNTNRSNDLVSTEQWMWCCALAYWQLLLLRQVVEDARPAWHARVRNGKPIELTPGQAQRAAARYLQRLGTPAKAPKVAGKGTGRSNGFRPVPRKRYEVIKKAKTGQKQVPVTP